jgi:hypothetical protein
MGRSGFPVWSAILALSALTARCLLFVFTFSLHILPMRTLIGLNIRKLTLFVSLRIKFFPVLLRCVVLVGIEPPEYIFNEFSLTLMRLEKDGC